MPIVTDFKFQHMHTGATPGLEGAAEEVKDFLGLLRPFVGGAPHSDSSRTWEGPGFNMIWRPNRPGEAGPDNFFLQLNMTHETLSFKEISGSTGVANRGFFQPTTFLGAVAYTQEIKDTFDGSGQHFEPGVWGHVDATTDPAEPESVFRLGSIPHGTTVNMQGHAFVVEGPPRFDVSSIIPFTEGSRDDGLTDIIHFFDKFTDLSIPTSSRTPNAAAPGLTTAQLQNPNLFLSQAIAGQTITRTTVLVISSVQPDPPPPPRPPVPDVGGGNANIAFLIGNPPDQNKVGARPNANAAVATAIFWVEEGTDVDGSPLLQLQYTQRVLLNFEDLSWPHVTVATMRPQKS